MESSSSGAPDTPTYYSSLETVNPMMRETLKKVYEQMPEPKLVVAVGASVA